jgi:hypothetical protein
MFMIGVFIDQKYITSKQGTEDFEDDDTLHVKNILSFVNDARRESE